MSVQPSTTAVEAVLFLINERNLTVNEVSRRLDISPAKINDIIRKSQKKQRVVMNLVKGFNRSTYRGDSFDRVDRDPCFRCGVRRDVHDEGGCRKWRPAP
jgi:hypothetical protein